MTAIKNSADWAEALHAANLLLSEKEQQLKTALESLQRATNAATDSTQHQHASSNDLSGEPQLEVDSTAPNRVEEAAALRHQLEERQAALQAALVALDRAQLELAAVREANDELQRKHQTDTGLLTAAVAAQRTVADGATQQLAAIRSDYEHLLQQHQLDTESGNSALAAARQAVTEAEAAHAQALEGHRIELSRLRQDLAESEHALSAAQHALAISTRDRLQFAEERSELQRALEFAHSQRDRVMAALDTLQSAHEKQIEVLRRTIEISTESSKQSQDHVVSLSACFEAQRVKLEERLTSAESARDSKQLELDRALQDRRDVEQRLVNTLQELSEAQGFRQQLTSDLALAKEQALLNEKWHETLRLQEQELRQEAQQALAALREDLQQTRLRHQEANQIWQQFVERERQQGQDQATAFKAIHAASLQHAQERYETLLNARAEAQLELAAARLEVTALQSELDAATHHWTYRLTHWLRPQVRSLGLDQRASGGADERLKGETVDIGSSPENDSASDPQAATVLTPRPHQTEFYDATPMTSDKNQPTTVANVDELLGLYDKEFVEAAYAALLGRQADPTGLNAHLRLIRRGHSPESVIAGIARSDEYIARGRKLDGLPELLRSERHSLGNLASKFVSRYVATSARRNAELMRRTSNDVMRRLDFLAHKVDALSSKVEGIEAKLAAGLSSTNSVHPQLITAPTPVVEYASNVRIESSDLNMSPRALNILDEIKRAIQRKKV